MSTPKFGEVKMCPACGKLRTEDNFYYDIITQAGMGANLIIVKCSRCSFTWEESPLFANVDELLENEKYKELIQRIPKQRI